MSPQTSDMISTMLTLMTDTVQLFLAGECRVHQKERIVSGAERDEG
jgi:hypothetical protein